MSKTHRVFFVNQTGIFYCLKNVIEFLMSLTATTNLNFLLLESDE